MNWPSPVSAGRERLVVRDLTKRYGGVVALSGVDLTLRAGEVHALLGENGAGKSTVVRIIAGAVAPDGGDLLLDGSPVALRDPRGARGRGIAVVSQELNLFGDLDVLTNLHVHAPPRRGGVLSRGTMRRMAEPHVRALGLDDLNLSLPLGRLGLADRQLVEIARAMIGAPRVLVLDEPTSALADAATKRLLDVVRRIRDTGVAVLFVSHFLQEVAAVADRVTVLRDGRNALTDRPARELSVADMVSAMLGHAGPEPTAARTSDPRSPSSSPSSAGSSALRVRGLHVPGQVHGVDLDVRAGEIVGLVGLEGAGHTTVLEALWGRCPGASGEVATPQRPAGRLFRRTAQALTAGVAFVPSDRKRLGLMLESTVWENVTSASSLAMPGAPGRLRPHVLRRETRRWVDELRIRGDVDSPAGSLSGGNQQKVVFAKWLRLNPRIFLLDDPTRGVDVGARSDMHALIRQVAARGCAVLMCSTDLLEISELCDRVLLMRQGRLVRSARPEELTEAGLVHALNALSTNGEG